VPLFVVKHVKPVPPCADVQVGAVRLIAEDVDVDHDVD
jgi:hypothetical protein